MQRLSTTSEAVQRVRQAAKYKRLLYAMWWFHAVLAERRKSLLTLGSPSRTTSTTRTSRVRALPAPIPRRVRRDAGMRSSTIAEINYGGRVTDDSTAG